MAVIKVGVVCMGVHESSYLKEELAWDTDKRLRVISIIMSFNKAVANSPVGQVLAGPLFLKVKTKFNFTKSK